MLLLLVATYSGRGQESLKVNRWIDSLNKVLVDSIPFSYQKSLEFAPKAFFDSSLLKPNLKKPIEKVSIKNNKAIQFNGGYLRYDFAYRSSIDTPFQEEHLGVHLFLSQLNFTLFNSFPISVVYFERQSNSLLFRDFRDVRVDLNTYELDQIQKRKLTDFSNRLTDRIRDPFVKPFLNYSAIELNKLSEWFSSIDVQNKLIRSRSTVLNSSLLDSNQLIKDSILTDAKSFISYHEAMESKYRKAQVFKDSLERDYIKRERQVQYIHGLLKDKSINEQKLSKVRELASEYNVEDKQLHRSFKTFQSFKTLSIGRTLPNHSDLTLRNVNVRGVNLEYNNRIYLAFAAGAIDFRARDFIYQSGRKPQFVYSGRIGYGSKEGNHIILTGFKGKKQFISSLRNAPALEIYGLSFATQVLIENNHRFNAEIAQSSAHSFSLGQSHETSNFDLEDHKNKAYSLRLRSSLPKLQSKWDLFYQYRGINFQSFSNFYSNATQRSWHVKFEQQFFKRKLQLRVSFQKNSFENPFTLTRYNGNTTFKNLSLTFRKKRWPTLSTAYMPSSQLSEINGTIYENFYQTLTFNVSHGYKVGSANAFSLFSYNQFFNDGADSGFIYFNAKNFYFSQIFFFPSYTANLTISRTQNPDYVLTVVDAGANAKVYKESFVGGGVKINQLNAQELRTGIYGRFQLSVKRVGELNCQIEKAFLPGSKGRLYKSEFYTIGFVRHINKSL